MIPTSLVLALLAFTADEPRPIAVTPPKPARPVSYAREVSEILAAKCVGCHNASLAEGKLAMEDIAGLLKGGKHGPAIKVGNPDESLLFQRWRAIASSR